MLFIPSNTRSLYQFRVKTRLDLYNKVKITRRLNIKMSSLIPSADTVLKSACDLFRTEFKCCPEIAACAPGRVNLIGEHTDYNEGFVLPMALPFVTIVAGKGNGTNEVRLCTTLNDADHPHKIIFSLNDEIRAGKPKWANYVKGVIAKFKKFPIPGFDAIIVSSLPANCGLSSSAALEVACFTFLEILINKKSSSPIEKARACQEAEHIYAGVPCGIMDQLVSVLGRQDHALLIDCRTFDVTYVPFDDSETVILITNSKVKHELNESQYALRRKQCEDAANHLGKNSLRDAMELDILDLEKKGVSKTVISRAKHVIKENRRTKEGARALEQKNYVLFGNLMVESHNSLRDDFEVSCEELDKIVEAALEVKGVYGCRMTGGGFGGCTVALVKREAVDECINNIKLRYTGDPVFFVCKASAGARLLTLVQK